MGRRNKNKNSVSNWESSYYGGYYNVLNRHPDIVMDNNISWKAEDGKAPKLAWWLYSKLVKMFLLKVNEYELTMTLIRNMQEIEEDDDSYALFGFMRKRKKKKILKLSKESIRLCIDSLANSNDELANLFKYYKDTLMSTTLSIPINTQNSPQGIFMNINAVKRYASDWNSQGKVVTRRAVEEGHKYNPTERQIALSNRLVDMLDITFDPTYGRVDNLRNGKLNTGKLAEIVAGNLNVYYHDVENQNTKPFTVCILMDESGSMRSEDRLAYQMDLVTVLWEAFIQVLPEDKIYVYGHSTQVGEGKTPELRIYNDPLHLNFEKTINWSLNSNHGNNYDSEIIDQIYSKIRFNTDDNILFICVSDGQPCGDDEPKKKLQRTVERCKRNGFVTAGIGIRSHHVKEIYNHHLVITELDNDIPQKVSRLLNHVVKTEFQD